MLLDGQRDRLLDDLAHRNPGVLVDELADEAIQGIRDGWGHVDRQSAPFRARFALWHSTTVVRTTLDTRRVAATPPAAYRADTMQLLIAEDALILLLDREPVTVERLAGDDQILLHRDRQGRPAAIEVLGLRAHGLLSVSRLDDDAPQPQYRAMEIAARLAARTP